MALKLPRFELKQSRFGVLALLGATLFWAGNYVVGGEVVAGISPLDLTTVRWVIAVIPLALLAQLVERPDWRGAVRSWPSLVAPAVLGLAAYNLLLYSALEHTTAVRAALINAFNPAMIALAGAAFLGQQLTREALAGVALALIGVVWVISGGEPARLLDNGFGAGDLLMLAAIGAWTAYTILGQRRTGVSPITATAIQAAIVIILLTPMAFAANGPRLPSDPQIWWALIYIGVFPSVASYGLWNFALTQISPARAGVFLNLITVFTVVISVAIGQQFTLAQAIGGMLVLAGVVLTNRNAFKRPT